MWLDFIVDFLSFIIIKNWIDVHISRVIAFYVAVNATYVLNSIFTFAQMKGNYGMYVFGQSKGFIINFLVFEAAFLLLSGKNWAEELSFVAGSIVALLFNYMYAKIYCISVGTRLAVS